MTNPDGSTAVVARGDTPHPDAVAEFLGHVSWWRDDPLNGDYHVAGSPSDVLWQQVHTAVLKPYEILKARSRRLAMLARHGHRYDLLGPDASIVDQIIGFYELTRMLDEEGLLARATAL